MAAHVLLHCAPSMSSSGKTETLTSASCTRWTARRAPPTPSPTTSRSERNMKIIIVAPENDNHTVPIKWALEKAGYTVVCWAGVAWTEPEHVSLLFEDRTSVRLGPHTVDPGDVVWIRRPEQPVHNPNVSEADKKFAETEYRSFYYCITYLLQKLPVWVINRYSVSRFTINKSVQLLIARNCGLKVPKSLMSNSPNSVKDFLEHNTNRTICKAFMPHVWQRSDRSVAVTETF